MLKEKISIIVPVYNVEQYLPQCLDSIINQTYRNLEILLIDDGSTDNSGKICDEYAKLDNRIRVFHKKNEGLSSARNLGINNCTGSFIGFVDSDDFVELDMYEILYNEQQRINADIVWCNYYNYFSKENYSMVKVFNKNKYYKLPFNLNELGLDIFNNKYHEHAQAWSKLYKKSIFDNIKYPYGKTFEDLFIFLSTLMKANIISTVSRPLYYYRINRPNSILNVSNKKIINIDILEAYIIFTIDYAHYFSNLFQKNILLFDSYKTAFDIFVKKNYYPIYQKVLINQLKVLYNKLPLNIKCRIIRRCFIFLFKNLLRYLFK